jgi:hypothetical protein
MQLPCLSNQVTTLPTTTTLPETTTDAADTAPNTANAVAQPLP